MRKEIIEYAEVITKNTPLSEVTKIVENIEELEYLLKSLEKKSE
mgnify:CR=1 FL=1